MNLRWSLAITFYSWDSKMYFCLKIAGGIAVLSILLTAQADECSYP